MKLSPEDSIVAYHSFGDNYHIISDRDDMDNKLFLGMRLVNPNQLSGLTDNFNLFSCRYTRLEGVEIEYYTSARETTKIHANLHTWLTFSLRRPVKNLMPWERWQVASFSESVLKEKVRFWQRGVTLTPLTYEESENL